MSGEDKNITRCSCYQCAHAIGAHAISYQYKLVVTCEIVIKKPVDKYSMMRQALIQLKSLYVIILQFTVTLKVH